MRIFKVAVMITLVTVVCPASAAEVLTYVYDAKGRIIKVVRSGSVNNSITVYTHDRVNNRKSVRR